MLRSYFNRLSRFIPQMSIGFSGVGDDADTGQGLVEYAMLLILVAVVMIAIVSLLAPGIGNTYSTIVQSL